ncbi:MAG: metallophosphoesterase [Verrucomicrobia bacterium]|nr:metallophosphoesterase [Verrucomicrobiota bacterium]
MTHVAIATAPVTGSVANSSPRRVWPVLSFWLASMAGLLAAPTALVFEFEDRWSQATGAVALCEQAGFDVRTQLMRGAMNLDGVDLVLLGSFLSEHASYAGFMELSRASLLQFVHDGGVLLQLTQADQTESTPPFLPEPLQARRGDGDYAPLWMVTGEHPLLDGLPRQADQIVIPTHLGRPPNWEALTFHNGFRVLLASEPELADYALLEGAHGAGRILLGSLFPDKIYRAGTLVADATMLGIARQFFTNLLAYVQQVRAGTAPEVVPTRPPEPLPFVPGSWTLAVLPDTQYYTVSTPEIFEAQTRWIVNEKTNRNIVYVLHLGDIVNNNALAQWTNAQAAMRILDGHVPYAIVPGNHDYGVNGSAATRDTYFNDFFPSSNYVHWPTLGGAFEPARMDNTWHQFHAGGHDWLILALEFGPRNPVVAWADSVVAQHPSHKVILITHAYLYFDNTRYDWATKGSSQSWSPHAYGTANDPLGTNDGEELWQKLVRKHPGFAFTVNGHVLNDGLGRLSSWGDHTNIVHQMLVNYQVRALGGEGYLRLLEFLPDGNTLQVKAYSPYLDRYLTDNQNQFVLDLAPPPPSPRPPSEVPLLFEDPFDQGIDGWTPVQPEGYYLDGPMRWQYDIVSQAFAEQSNIYTDAAAASPTATAVMLVNQALTPEDFTLRARLTAGDDDGFGLIFGYQDEETFYRVTFSRQTRSTAGFPWNGWSVDRKDNGATTVLFGDGSPGHVGSFTNTAGRPFDVTLSVTGSNRFSLTVVDNPGLAPAAWPLVRDGLLPNPAAGRVGLMTWGMSGGTPRGFRIANLSLEPVPLSGDPNTLVGWTPVVPPQANGNTSLVGGNGGAALWSLAVSATGPAGNLVENSDAYAMATAVGDNANLDFTGPCLVAGDTAWTNLTVRTRITPADDDAHGLLLRYQDEHHFYRVTLHGTAGMQTGRPPPGLSVQKVVAGQWAEVYRETVPRHIPAANTPYDIAASLWDQWLFVRVTVDPDNLTQTLDYGPIAIPAPVLDHGKIGLFSWGMLQTRFDHVRVEGLIPLRIASLRTSHDTLSLAVQNPAPWPYDVEIAPCLDPGSWTLLLPAQTAHELSLPVPPPPESRYWRLKAACPQPVAATP